MQGGSALRFVSSQLSQIVQAQLRACVFAVVDGREGNVYGTGVVLGYSKPSASVPANLH